MSPTDVQSLLRAAPWLRKYGTLLAERLVRLGVNEPEQIADVDRERFAALPDVGQFALLDLLSAQIEFAQRRLSSGSPPARVKPNSLVRDIPTIRERYPVRLLNSLGKFGANTVEQVVRVTADEFAKVHGVGARQIRLLDELQTELRALLARNDSSADDRAIEDGTSSARPADPVALGEEEPQPFDEQPLDALWEVWSQLPVPLRNCLGVNGIRTVAQVLEMTPADFAKLRGVGAKRVQAFVELRETLRLMRVQQGVGAVHASAPEIRLDSPTCPQGEPAPETAAKWDSLDALLRDVATRVSVNRTHTAEKERNLEIWLSYHGLGPAAVDRTLDAVGAVHGLTRERVRQIVTRLNRIIADEIARSAALRPFREALGRTMARCLGLARAEDLAAILAEEMGWEQPPGVELLRTFLNVTRGTPLGYRCGQTVVAHRDACGALRERVAERAESLLLDIHESEHILDFVYHLSQACRNGTCRRPRFTSEIPCCGGEKGETCLPREYVTAVLSEMTPCPLDGDRVWGYWWTRLRLPRPKTEAVRAALHILARPVHYRELTEFICKHNPAFSPSDSRYVLNQLISDDQYVLTGKLGTYGLREWGAEEYVTVGDRVEQLLREHGRPLPQGTITRLLKETGVSENNIQAALMQQRFTKDLDGCVGLTEWATDTAGVLTGSGPMPVLIGDDEDTGYIL